MGFGDPTKGMTRIWGHFVILVGCERVILRPQIMLKPKILLWVLGPSIVLLAFFTYLAKKKWGTYTFKVKGEKMNYTRFSRTGKEQQTLLFFKRSRGNSATAKEGNIYFPYIVLFSTESLTSLHAAMKKKW